MVGNFPSPLTILGIPTPKQLFDEFISLKNRVDKLENKIESQNKKINSQTKKIERLDTKIINLKKQVATIKKSTRKTTRKRKKQTTIDGSGKTTSPPLKRLKKLLSG